MSLQSHILENIATVAILTCEAITLVLTQIFIPFYQMSLKHLHLHISVPGLISFPNLPSFLWHHHSFYHQDRNLIYSIAPSPHILFLMIKSYWFLLTYSLIKVPLLFYLSVSTEHRPHTITD